MNTKKTAVYISLPLAVIGFTGLFVLVFCYIVCGLALFSLGLISAAAAALHKLGVLFVATDFSVMALLLTGLGGLFLGAAMLLGTASVCPGSVRLFHRYARWYSGGRSV